MHLKWTSEIAMQNEIVFVYSKEFDLRLYKRQKRDCMYQNKEAKSLSLYTEKKQNLVENGLLNSFTALLQQNDINTRTSRRLVFTSRF
jgi:hypothetical protein